MLGPLLVSLLVASCPPGMVFANERVCIDRLAWPNDENAPTRFGLSALPETYLDLRGETWDLEALCASRGKRTCTAREWRSACEGTVTTSCPAIVSYRAPRWDRVRERDPFELLRLDPHHSWRDYPACVGSSGARMMTTAQEWVRRAKGYAFSRGYWSRQGGCGDFITSHDPRWHDYATTGRCCLDL